MLMKDIFEKIINYIPSYLVALAAVFSAPKTFIGKLQLDTESEWLNALIFLGISTVLVSFLDLVVHPSADVWRVVISKLITVLLMVAYGAVTVRFSWWLVGGNAAAR